MHIALRPYVSAGVVIVGTGLAVAALAVPPAAIEGQAHRVALTAGPSDEAFTIDGTTFDPGADGYNDFDPFVGVAPLLKIGFGSLGLGTNPLPTQDLEVYDSSGTDLGAALTSVNASDLLGIDSSQFTVQFVVPPAAEVEAALTNSDLDLTGVNVGDLANAFTGPGTQGPAIDYGSDITSSDVFFALLHANITLPSTITDAEIADVLNGVDTSDLPTVGTVYSITNIGGGFANVYEAVPSSDGTSGSTITDTLVTPFGNMNIPTTFDAAVPMSPGDAFANFAATSDNTDISANAFTLGGITFDPGTDGFTPVSPVLGVAPLLEIGGGTVSLGGLTLPLAGQNFEVYGSDGTDLGSVTTSENVQNLLGIESTQFAVTNGTPVQGGDAADLPADGTVYSVTNLGSGWANVYIATPNADGTAAASITDTLVTPNGPMNIPTTFDAIAPMDPGEPFAGLGVASDVSGASDNAFTIDGTTFDPGADGFDPIAPTAGIAPLLEIGGGQLAGLLSFATQDLDVYGSDGELGSVETSVNTSNLLGLIDTTQFTVTSYDDVPASDLVSALDNSDISFTGAGFDANDLVTALENANVIGANLGGGALTGDDISNMLGTTINLSAAGIDPNNVANVINGAVDAYGTANDLPDLGTVYSVTDFGGGFENVYEAVPNSTGTAASSITDYLVTPWGNIDLSSMFDAIAQLDPGDAAAGVTVAGSSAGDAAAEGFNLFDPSTWF